MGGRGSWNPIDVAKDAGKSFVETNVGLITNPVSTLDDLGKNINQKFNNTGAAIEKGVNDALTSVEKASQDTQSAVQKALIDTGNVFDPSQWKTGLEMDTDTTTDSGTIDSTSTDTAPVYSEFESGTATAKRRRSALALQRGLMSTVRSAGSQSGSSAVLTPSASSGKSKLGQ